MDSMFQQFANVLQNVLPLSPFRGIVTFLEDMPYMGWLNYFFPVHEILVIFGLWLGAYAAFLAYSVVYRWMKVIQG